MIEMQTWKSFTGSNKDNFLARVSIALRIVPFTVVDRALNFKSGVYEKVENKMENVVARARSNSMLSLLYYKLL